MPAYLPYKTNRIAECQDKHINIQTDAAKAAGQKKQVYESAYQTVEKILGLRCRLGIHELAIQCGCSEVRELAQSVLRKYEDNMKAKLSADRQRDLDLSKPIYAIGALQAAAKKQKVRIDKKRLQSLVSGQRAALNQLTSAMEDCLKQIEDERQEKRSSHLLDCLEEVNSGGDIDIDAQASKRQRLMSDETLENYEQWKYRILNAAEKVIAAGKGHVKPS